MSTAEGVAGAGKSTTVPVPRTTHLSAKEVSSRGHAIVAAAGRVLGAIGAAGPEAAAAAMSKGLAPLLDAAGVGEDGNAAITSAAAKPLALVLATPAACGALDGAARSARSGVSGSAARVLETTGGRLVRLFAEAATDREGRENPAGGDEKDATAAAAIDADDAATLGIAGLRTLLSFPEGTGLTSDAHARRAALALVAAATAPDEGASSADTEPSRAADLRRRAGDALGAAAAAKDARVAAAAENEAMPALLSLATTEESSADALAKARRALEAVARVVAAAPAARRGALAPLCAAAASRAHARWRPTEPPRRRFARSRTRSPARAGTGTPRLFPEVRSFRSI